VRFVLTNLTFKVEIRYVEATMGTWDGSRWVCIKASPPKVSCYGELCAAVLPPRSGLLQAPSGAEPPLALTLENTKTDGKVRTGKVRGK
jgi:hypothetical protein